MEREIIKYLCGLFLTGIVPPILIRQLQKGAVFSGIIENQRRMLYIVSISSISIISAINKNTEILMGTLIGCAIFQLLGVYGVNKLNAAGNWKEKLPVSKIQFLIFCTILLLFLSADYLLRGKAVENIINQVDGGLLIFLFSIYFYFSYIKGEDSALSIYKRQYEIWWKNHKKNTNKQEQIDNFERYSSRKKRIAQIFTYLLLIVIILIGNYFLFEGVSKLGVDLEVSQYCAGLTLMAWSVNLLGILLENMAWKSEDNVSNRESLEIECEDGEALLRKAAKEEKKIENLIEGIIFSLTFLLGCIALIEPIMTHIYMIYDLIILGIISILFQFISKIDNRLAGSGMEAVYIGFIVYTLMRS